MSTTAFSTSDDVIERKLNCFAVPTEEHDLETFYQVSRCVDWIKEGGFLQVALQFPDEHLVDAPSIAQRLQWSIPEATIFVLGDTSYGSCCVDEVGAEHHKADSLIHFGRACLSPTHRLPVLYIFGQSQIHVQDCVDRVLEDFPEKESPIVLVYETNFLYVIDNLFEKLRTILPNLLLSRLNMTEDANQSDVSNFFEDATSILKEKVHDVNSNHMVCKCGRVIPLPRGQTIDNYTFLFIGGTEGPALINMMMTFNKSPFYSYNPQTSDFRRETVNINKALMRRFYLIERVKDANIVGIIAGTLGVSRYREMIDHLKSLLKRCGKKSYTFVVGKLNPAKLANFAEIDLHVLVSCPESVLLDQAEFYQPVVSPFEVELALNPAYTWTGDYTLDFRELLPGGVMHVPSPETTDHQEDRADVSLITNKARVLGQRQSTEASGGQEVVARNQNLAISNVAENAAEFLASRSWQGLEQRLGETPVVKASEGTIGIAASYAHEPGHNS